MKTYCRTALITSTLMSVKDTAASQDSTVPDHATTVSTSMVTWPPNRLSGWNICRKALHALRHSELIVLEKKLAFSQTKCQLEAVELSKLDKINAFRFLRGKNVISA